MANCVMPLFSFSPSARCLAPSGPRLLFVGKKKYEMRWKNKVNGRVTHKQRLLSVVFAFIASAMALASSAPSSFSAKCGVDEKRSEMNLPTKASSVRVVFSDSASVIALAPPLLMLFPARRKAVAWNVWGRSFCMSPPSVSLVSVVFFFSVSAMVFHPFSPTLTPAIIKQDVDKEKTRRMFSFL